MSLQTISSARTSRSQVPALHRALLASGVWSSGDTNADIGGGKYNLGTEALARHGVENVVYDPYNRSEDWNRDAMARIARGTETATVANVLNVIREPEARSEVIRLARKTSHRVFFVVYEGDRSGAGRATRDGWQENRKLATYVSEIVKHFARVEIRSFDGLRIIEATC